MAKYYIKYKVFSIPYYYEFTCYADSPEEAQKLFLLNVDGMIEDYRIAYIENIAECHAR